MRNSLRFSIIKTNYFFFFPNFLFANRICWSTYWDSRCLSKQYAQCLAHLHERNDVPGTRICQWSHLPSSSRVCWQVGWHFINYMLIGFKCSGCQEDVQKANRSIKRCSASLVIRELQIKTKMKQYFLLVRMAINKKTRDRCGERGCGERGILVQCWWNL